MIRWRATPLAALILCFGLGGEARGQRGAQVLHTTSPGDTLESLADRYYGNRSLAPFLRAVNHLPSNTPLQPRQRIKIPGETTYRLRSGEKLKTVAKRWLGDDRRASFLGTWNGLQPGADPRPGMKLTIPPQVAYRVGPGPEGFDSLAKTMLGSSTLGPLLKEYNFSSTNIAGSGMRVLIPMIPLGRARLRTTRAPAEAVARSDPKDEERRAVRFQSQWALVQQKYDNGDYNAVPGSLAKLLSEGAPSPEQWAAIHRLFAFTYVALGLEELAQREFRDMLVYEPDAKLDPATVSPKILEIFERAKARP